MNSVSRSFPLLLALAGISTLAGAARAATYLPLSDEELARRAPVIVRARVVAQETRVETVDGRDTAMTVTRFQPLEVIKGRIASETFEIELPGGVVGDVATWVPGTPSFAALAEVVLFLSPDARGDECLQPDRVRSLQVRCRRGPSPTAIRRQDPCFRPGRTTFSRCARMRRPRPAAVPGACAMPIRSRRRSPARRRRRGSSRSSTRRRRASSAARRARARLGQHRGRRREREPLPVVLGHGPILPRDRLRRRARRAD